MNDEIMSDDEAADRLTYLMAHKPYQRAISIHQINELCGFPRKSKRCYYFLYEMDDSPVLKRNLKNFKTKCLTSRKTKEKIKKVLQLLEQGLIIAPKCEPVSFAGWEGKIITYHKQAAPCTILKVPQQIQGSTKPMIQIVDGKPKLVFKYINPLAMQFKK